MKNVALILLMVAIQGHAVARDRVAFTISRPLCLLTFLQAASQTQQVAPSLTTYIKKNMAHNDEAAFGQLVQEFASIDFDINYVFPQYPEKRQHPKSVINLVTIAAVNSATVDEFMQRIVGVLPNEQWLKLKRIMTQSEAYYEKLIAAPYKDEIHYQLGELVKYNNRVDTIFGRLKHFYGSTWADDMPFTISIYPVPGKRGSTSATPHSNSLVLAVLTSEDDYAMCVGIGVHEICHVLYQEQPLTLQRTIDSLFSASTSLYAPYAYGYIDEALATACGNGWAYEALSGHRDKTGWYNDDYIDGYAHAIFPMVKDYIEGGRAIDKAFIDSAIAIFTTTFPDAVYDYRNLLNRVNLYTDAADHEEYRQITAIVGKQFRMSSCSGSYPITDPQSLDLVSSSVGTQFFIVYTSHEKNVEALINKFPQLKGMPARQYGITSFFDAQRRPVIILNVPDVKMLEQGLKALSKNKKLDPERMFTPL